MAVKISQLPDATELTGDELVPLVQDGETRHAAASLLGGTRAVTLSLTVPPEVASGDNWNIDATATSRHNGGSIAAFEVDWWDGTSETVTASAGAATLTKTVNETDGTALAATVRALDDIGNASKPETATATATAANSPPQGPITISAPTQTGKGSTFQVSFSGATDPDSDPITYTITDPGTFTFTKTSGITGGEIVDAAAPDVTSETDVTFSVVAVDDSGAQSATYSETVTVTAAQVIGVEMTATGGPGGTWNHIDESGAAITSPTTSWFNGHPVWGGMQDVVVDGQDMVEIPKFYYKRGTSAAGNPAWWISDQPATDFTVMPAFVLDGVECDKFEYGKYQASLDGNNKLQSIPGVMPQVETTLIDFMAYASNRNVSGVAGFRVLHYDMLLAIQWLYLIEMATMDSQAATGQGRVIASNAANVDASDVAQATYRGIVGLWGNVWQLIDGLRTNNANGDVIERRTYNGAWVSTGESLPNPDQNLYPITFRPTGDDFWVADTYSINNDYNATMPEVRKWKNLGEYYAVTGGFWSSNDSAGIWAMLCAYSDTFTAIAFCSRLARITN